MGETQCCIEVAVAIEEIQTTSFQPNTIVTAPRYVWRLAMSGLMGYGYKPYKLLWWFLSVWIVFSLIYWMFAVNGNFGPSNPIVFQDLKYTGCAPSDRQRSLHPSSTENFHSKTWNWYFCPELREEYTGFSPWLFSLDALLPVVDLQQNKDWGPLTPTPLTKPWSDFFTFELGHLLRLLIIVQNLFGWIFTVMLAQLVTGWIRSERFAK